MPKRPLPRFQNFNDAPPPPTPREMVLRYSALALAFILILSSLTLRADPKFSSGNNAIHGSFNGFLPLPMTNAWGKDDSDNTEDDRPATAMPPALIAPALMPANSPDRSLPADTPDNNDSAINLPYLVGRSAYSSTLATRTTNASRARLISSHNPPPVKFDGD